MEDEPPTVFRLFSPIKRQPDTRAKHDHVRERNRQESICALLVQHNGIEPGHHHRDYEAQYNHHRGQPGSKPAEQAVHADLPRAHQGRLSDKEDHPRGKGGGVHPQKERPWRVGVEQVVVSGATEAHNHNRGQCQRHAEIEIPAQECLEPLGCGCFFPNGSSEPYASYGHRRCSRER
jgi:hypothetical protein